MGRSWSRVGALSPHPLSPGASELVRPWGVPDLVPDRQSWSTTLRERGSLRASGWQGLGVSRTRGRSAARFRGLFFPIFAGTTNAELELDRYQFLKVPGSCIPKRSPIPVVAAPARASEVLSVAPTAEPLRKAENQEETPRSPGSNDATIHLETRLKRTGIRARSGEAGPPLYVRGAHCAPAPLLGPRLSSGFPVREVHRTIWRGGRRRWVWRSVASAASPGQRCCHSNER